MFHKNFRFDDNKIIQNRFYTYKIQDILSYIHRHFKEGISQKDVAKQFSISSQYLAKLFKKHLGINYLKYVNSLRLNQALYELEFTDKTITEIVYDCGFPNARSFLREFKNEINMQPRLYRKMKK